MWKSAMTGLRLQMAGTGLPLGTGTVRNDLFKGKKEKENWFHLQFVCVRQIYLWAKSFMKPTPGNSSSVRNANIYWLK